MPTTATPDDTAAARARPRSRGKQLELAFRTHGGRREGAGRKRSGPVVVSHSSRPALDARHPAHVTLTVRRDVPYLRTERLMRRLRRAFAGARDRHGLRLVHYAVQGAHLHLVVEAEGSRSLSRGVQGLAVRIARGLNDETGRGGKVFADRYHARALATPREVRNVIAYVLLNGRHHAARRGLRLPPGRRPDPCSSGSAFDGWSPGGGAPPRTAPVDEGVVPPRTWLLRAGWRRHGLVDPAEIPGR